jgi:hypothetical protein
MLKTTLENGIPCVFALYRTLDNKIDGVVIVLIDSDPRLRLKQP